MWGEPGSWGYRFSSRLTRIQCHCLSSYQVIYSWGWTSIVHSVPISALKKLTIQKAVSFPFFLHDRSPSGEIACQ